MTCFSKHMSMYAHHYCIVDMQEEAVMALSHLSVHSALQPSMMAAGAARVLVNFSQSSSIEVSQSALFALCHLASGDPEHRLQICTLVSGSPHWHQPPPISRGDSYQLATLANLAALPELAVRIAQVSKYAASIA